jgi:hypothetical protein
MAINFRLSYSLAVTKHSCVCRNSFLFQLKRYLKFKYGRICSGFYCFFWKFIHAKFVCLFHAPRCEYLMICTTICLKNSQLPSSSFYFLTANWKKNVFANNEIIKLKFIHPITTSFFNISKHNLCVGKC